MLKNELDLSVIVVSWNVRSYLAPCLRSIQAAIHGLRAEIFVVDNASKDGSAWMVAQDFPEIKLIANRQNLGFGRANNQALRVSRGKYVLLINPDTLVPPDAIHILMDFLDRCLFYLFKTAMTNILSADTKNFKHCCYCRF